MTTENALLHLGPNGLTVVFIILAIIGTISWPWWAILMPTFLYIIGWLTALGGGEVLGGIAEGLGDISFD